MGQDSSLEKQISIEGTLLMLDDVTPHSAVPVQAICNGLVVSTVLSDEHGRYQFANLKPGQYRLRCQVLDGYVYYRTTNKLLHVTLYKEESLRPSTGESAGEILLIEDGKILENIDFHFAAFKRGAWKNYDYLDGLSGNAVFGICHDMNGAMWFATSTGASRYDGKEFANLTARDGLVSDYICAIHCDFDGVMWFGTFANGISRYDGQVVNFTTEDGLVGNAIKTIYQSSDGAMWFGTGSGVSWYDGKEFISFTKEDGLADDPVYAIHRDPDGVMWFGTRGGISRHDGKEFVSFTATDGLADNIVNAIHRDPDGVMWFGTYGGVSRYDGEKFINITTMDGLTDNKVRVIHHDLDGILWFGTGGSIGSGGRGVSRYDGKGFVNFVEEDGLVGNNVNDIYRDPDGVMWFALWGGGVSRYDPSQLINFSTRELLASDAMPDGSMWLATRSGTCQCDGKELVNFSRLIEEKELVGVSINTVYCDSDGVMWFAPFSWPSGAGVFRYDGKELVKFTTEDGLTSNYVTAIHSDPDGTMWFGTWGGGVSRYDGKEFVNFTIEDGLVCNDVNAIWRDLDGVMWFGAGYWGSSGGVSRYDGKEFINFTTEDGLADNAVWAIYGDPDGVMWFGTAWGGVSRYDGKEFVNFTTEDGLSCNWVWVIHRSSNGVMWFGTRWAGISGYDGTAWTSLDIRDGVADAGNGFHSIIQDSDDSLWFAPGIGNPTRYRPSATPPLAYTISVTTDQTYCDKSDIPAFTAGTRVTIQYNSIDFKTLPEKRQYRCRIQAFGKSLSKKEINSEWRKPTKATSFDYIFDKPGKYIFEVQAIDRDLNYSEPAVVKLEVVPDPRDLKVSELEADLPKVNVASVYVIATKLNHIFRIPKEAIDFRFQLGHSQ